MKGTIVTFLIHCLFLTLTMHADPSQTLFSFQSKDAADRWFTVNDGVMGGISDGRVAVSEENTLLFSGNLSLENNGGFASIRSQPALLDLSGANGLLMRVRGDGRNYWADLRGLRQNSASSYRAALPTSGDKFEEIFIPFSSFRLTSFGRTVRGRPLDPDLVRSIGFTLSDKNEGPFALEIDSIRAVFSDSPEASRTTSPVDLILLAIDEGVPLFNNGSPEACRAVYEVACEALLGFSDIPESVREDLTQSLREISQMVDESEKAWVLRRVLDRSLEALE